MRNPELFWLGAIGVLAVTDALLDRRHDGSTLSEVTRKLFRTDTTQGSTAFTLALAGGGVVLHRHITKG